MESKKYEKHQSADFEMCRTSWSTTKKGRFFKHFKTIFEGNTKFYLKCAQFKFNKERD